MKLAVDIATKYPVRNKYATYLSLLVGIIIPEEVTHLRTKITSFLLISVLVIGLSACNLGDRNLTRGNVYDRDMGRTVTPYTYDGTRKYDYNNDNLYGNRYDNRYGYNMNGQNNQTYRFRTNANTDTDAMADIAARVRGVDNATVVVAGGNAYVGLNLDNSVQRNEAETVEQKVYNALKSYTNRYTISVTSDADLFGRLRDIGDGIRGGTPYDRYQTDFRDFDTRFRTFSR